MSYVEIINFIVSIVLIFLNFSMFYSLITHKKIRNKEENLFLYKTLCTVICFSFYIILFISIVFEFCENDRENILYKIQEYLFNIYIIIIYAINLFSSIEIYYIYKHPIHYFMLIFGKKSRKIYEFIIILLAILLIILDIIDPQKFDETLKIKNKEIKSYGSPFIIIDNFKWIFFILMNGLTMVFYFRLINILTKFYFEKRTKLLKMLRKKIICQYCYLCYAFYNILVAGILFMKPMLKNKSIIIIINSFFVFVILIIETIIELSIFSTTKFAQYMLSRNIIGYFSKIFPGDFKEELGYDIGSLSKIEDISSLKDTTSYEEEDSENEKSLIPKCSKDEELIYIYKNNIYIEDYFMSFFDQYLNILTASLFKIYNSKLFSAKEAQNKKLKEELGDLTVSRIGGIPEVSMTKDLSTTTLEEENYSNFSFSKTSQKDHFRLFRDILGNTPEEINVKILSYLTDNCVMNIIRFNLNPKQIAKSLISHFNLKRNVDDSKIEDKKYVSLTSSNVKEEYFKNLKKVSFKSRDKYFNFEFFETKDGSLSNYKVDILNNYFDYIQNGKGKTGSFLPKVIGIFKIKINDFNPVLLYISKNFLVDNIPNNFFTFWQLINFDIEKPKKLASSKITKKALVEEDNIFERVLLEAKNNNIYLKNYSEFSEIIENDFNFLKKNKIVNVNFLMMYLEFENTKKHETQGVVQIKKSNNNEAEIIDIKFNVKSMNNNNSLNNKETNDELIINKNNDKKDEENSDEIFSDEGFDYMPDVGKTAHNLMDYTEKVNISGFEGNYDDFFCMCFFTFENIFDLNNKFGMKPDDKFKNIILSKFLQYKIPEKT